VKAIERGAKIAPETTTTAAGKHASPAPTLKLTKIDQERPAVFAAALVAALAPGEEIEGEEPMTKRWSSSRSDATKTKREAARFDKRDFVLGPEEFDAFTEAIENPPEPNDKLKEAMNADASRCSRS
jgi:hypothetical protein